jgi:hypothetical protein
MNPICRRVLLATIAVGALTFESAAATVGRPITPRDAASTARFMSVDTTSDNVVSVSPDGHRYVIRLARGDVDGDGVWIDVLAGTLFSANSSSPINVAHLFSTGHGMPGYGGPYADALGSLSPLRWINSNKVAFLFSDQHEIRQIVTVDLEMKRTVFVTNVATQIFDFDISARGAVMYLAELPEPFVATSSKGGYIVPEGTDAMSIVAGYRDGSTADTRAARAVWFVQNERDHTKRVLVGARPTAVGYPQFQHCRLSPDGLHAVLSAPADTIPMEWSTFAEHGSESEKAVFRAAVANPSGIESRRITRLYLLDLTRSTAVPLWNAPAPNSWKSSWTPDSRYVAVTPIPVPTKERTDTNSNVQTAIFDASTSKHWILPGDASAVQAVSWLDSREIEIDSGAPGKERQDCYRLVKGNWQIKVPCRIHGATSHPVQITIRQDLNTPPKLYAVDQKSGSRRLLLDPNPGLKSEFNLGFVKYLEGTLTSGERWNALLTLPVHFVSGKRYPLVMQLLGPLGLPDRFTLYGGANERGLGPSFIAPHAAQILAGRDIAVLTFGLSAKWGSPSEADTTQRAFEELAKLLVEDGVADEGHIGISGFSRTGYFVYHAVSHSRFPFAAASVVDNVDYSYVQSVLTNNYANAEAVIGAPVRGAGLRTWLGRATGFNADSIHVPLLLVGQSGGTEVNILGQWEILSLLRWMRRPVEMYLMPDIDVYPAHNMQNPAQIVAVQERVVDWFDFWLNDHEMPDRAKIDQYMHWRDLKHLTLDGNALTPSSGSEPP